MRRQSETLDSLQNRDSTSEEIFDSGTFEWNFYRVSFQSNFQIFILYFFFSVSVQNIRIRKFVQHIH